ncbi:MAG TPA: alpha-amylase family glycosyl hydrolase [Vicinamibacterales bacterium]|nr:alpha-amylase family glycosyl hydrolase [Vicinamibacterales bacterium]
MRTHPHLYEISAWPWLERLSSRSGRRVTLIDVPGAEWDAIAATGMDVVYLMGVWQRSAVGRTLARTDLALLGEYDRALPGWSMDDVPGSPYSIQAYQPEARMGGWAGVDAARAALAARGMRLLLDFIPNHLGFDHAWIGAHPERFVQGTLDDYRAAPELFRPIESPDGRTLRFIACGRDPFLPPWRDVAQLNLFNPETREALVGELAAIARHCDGVRCDMAMLALNDVFARTWSERVDLLWRQPEREFWPDATARVPMIYLAEVYWDREYQLQQQGFHFTYDKRLLDRLRHGDAGRVRGHLQADPAYSARLARFLENHDEARSADALDGRVRAAVVLTFTLPGLRFFFDGQFAGAAVRAPVQLGRWAPEPDRPEIRELYARVLQALRDPLFHDGSWSLLDVRNAGDGTHGNLIASAWRLDRQLAVIAVNLSGRESHGFLDIGHLPPGDAFDLVDALTAARYHRTRADLENGLYVGLNAGDAHLLLLEGD